MIGGVKRWIHANTEQEYADKLMKLLDSKPPETGKHPFSEYAWNWFEVYSKPSIETVTVTTYKGYQVRVKLQKALQNPEISGSEVMLPWQKTA